MAYSTGVGGPGRSGGGSRQRRRGHVDPYALTVRPLVAVSSVAPVVDLRATLPAVPAGGGTADAWEHVVDYLRTTVAEASGAAVATDTIKSFDRRRGADQAQLAAVLAALDAGRPVAFYGWWPTAVTASTTEILGIDAMEVPPPDRKGHALVDGHAVVLVGYCRHAAFPGGGYLIVWNAWREDGWGDNGVGYMPFTFLRAYATELCTTRPEDGPARRAEGDGSFGAGTRAPSGTDQPAAGEPRVPAVVSPDPVEAAIDAAIRRHARCNDARGSLTYLFFSDDTVELARARAICSHCGVRDACRTRALQRAEPWGIWGGETFLEGRIVPPKRARGRPPKVPRPLLVVDEVTGVPIVA